MYRMEMKKSRSNELLEKYGPRAIAIADAVNSCSLDIIDIMAQYAYEWLCSHVFYIPSIGIQMADIVVSSLEEIYISIDCRIRKYNIHGSLLNEVHLHHSQDRFYFRCLTLSEDESTVFALAGSRVDFGSNYCSPFEYNSLDLQFKSKLDCEIHHTRFHEMRCAGGYIILYTKDGYGSITCIDPKKPQRRHHLDWKIDLGDVKSIFAFDVFKESAYFLNENPARISCYDLFDQEQDQEIRLSKDSEFEKNMKNQYTYHEHRMKIDPHGNIYIVQSQYTLMKEFSTIYIFRQDGSCKGKLHFQGIFKAFCVDPKHENKLFVLFDDKVEIYELG